MYSVRVKTTAITIVAILTSLLTVFSACYSTIQAENDRSSVEMMNLIGQDTRKSLEKYFDSIEQSVEMVANIASDTLDSVVLVECGVTDAKKGQKTSTPEQTARLDEYLARHCAWIQEAFQSVANHTHGVVTYYYCISPEVSRAEQGFYYSKVGKTGFDRQPPLDVGRLDPQEATNSWYYETIRRGRPSWVGPYTSPELNDALTYSYLVPIYKAGVFVGLLGMDIPFDTLIDQISPIRVFETGYACLIDTDNRMLYHPVFPMGTPPSEWGVPDLGHILQREASGQELIQYTADGISWHISFSTLTNGMKLAIIAPEKEINASWMRLTRIIVPTTLAVVAFYAVLTMLIMGIITRPLHRLTVASRELASGDYDVALEYKGRDEIGQLTSAFVSMRDQQKQYIEELNHRIYTDSLTDLPNMRYFFKLADTERRSMLDEGKLPAVVFFNLIGMKHYNRQYGFDEGDRLLREVARVLQRHFEGHSLGRINQDQFVVMTEEDGLETTVQAVFAECEDANGGRGLPVRVGVYPDRLEDVDITVACDRAKYASDQHRGFYVSAITRFDRNMLREAENVRYIISHLDQALSEGWIKVYYQAIIRTANGKVCDEEALSRWIDPVKGFLSPGEFIPILENARLIYKLDLYVLDQILIKLSQQRDAGLYVVPQSLNLSRVDFDSCDIVEEIRRRVDDAGIERSMLTIEITESMVGSDLEFIKAQVERFQALGFQVWMDDFGSGYSSLDVLQDIHFDLIKFDMRFMHRFGEGDKSRIILTELMKMAAGLGVETVCEGVETLEQVEFLREVGCTKLQGYYYGKPLPMDEILARSRRGDDMGFENPREAPYYGAIGRINLYDVGTLAGDEDESLRRFFNTIPMAILEVNGDQMKYIRCNHAYREFMERTFGISTAEAVEPPSKVNSSRGDVFIRAVWRCCHEASRVVVDERVGENTTAHTLLRHIAVNPVTGTIALAVAVLAVERDGELD